MVNKNAQEYINEKYPIDGVCKRDNDLENKNKKREEITTLDISKGKVGSKRKNKSLFGSLKLTGFTKLRTLICSSQQLTELDVSECPNLIELDCRYNELNTLNVNNCSYLEKLDCSNNYLRNLDISSCSELKELTCYSNKLSKDNVIGLSPNTKLILTQETDDKQPLIAPATEHDIRNVLLVGWTGNGKSTLANVLSDSNYFEAGELGISITKQYKKSDVFTCEGKKYCIIDNIGFGDTGNISKENLLYEVGRGIHSSKEGINQVLFVVKGKFTPIQIETFNMFKDFISQTGITAFTTIVKTGFTKFQNEQERENDRQNLLNESEQIADIINSCNGIIHVDNPTIFEIESGDDSDEKKEKQERNDIRKNKRKLSRKIAFNHLVNNCPKIYKLKGWDSIWHRVEEYLKNIEEKEKQLANSSDDSERNKLQGEITENKNKIADQVDVTFKAEISVLPKLGIEWTFKNFKAGLQFGSNKK